VFIANAASRVNGMLVKRITEALGKEMNTHLGYKIVGQHKRRAYSLYNPKQTISIRKGSVIRDPHGIYLGTSQKFCLDYYRGLVADGHNELMLIYRYHDRDVWDGDPLAANGEVKVVKATLVGYEHV
jgi:hypothetical protein